jgi:hypothetical protein
MTTRHFIAVRFNPWDRKTFTYHFDGETPPAIGDAVRVDARGDEKVVEVVAVSLHAPKGFDTKPILGPWPDQAAVAAGEAA